MIDFGIPPSTYSQREAIAVALDAQRRLILPEHVVGLRSPEETAAYLTRMGLRTRPFTADTVKRWRRTRRLPVISMGKKKWLTTNLHLFAWLCTYKNYKPVRS